MAPDALSEVLKTVQLTGAMFFDVAAKGPWVAEQPAPQVILPKILPGATRLIAYHMITEGQCFANLIGEEAIQLEAGDVVVFPRGDPHVVSSTPGMRADLDGPSAFDAAVGCLLPFPVTYSGDGPVAARIVCGFLACDLHPVNPLLDHLPAIIKANDRSSADRSAGDRSSDDAGWLSQFIQLATSEVAAKRPGSQSVLTKLSELMFVEVVRRHLQSLPPEQSGWLAGLRDPFIGKALSAIHGSAARNWTIEELAREVGLSRSVLAERFADLVGLPPMQYLAKWRMQIAAAQLSKGNANIAAIAADIGYGSEAAFSRAFKKVVGVSPSTWRQGRGC
jgi:AraC-like DNA-binding protein